VSATVLLAIGALIAVGFVLLKTTAGGVAHSFSLAIGVAEGGYDASGNNLQNGTAPSRNHNPGDLTIDTIGKATGKSDDFVVYATDADGYAALDAQVNLWLTGESANATSDSTIAQISQFYTTDSPPGAQADWASNVASVLGVSVDTPIGQIGKPAGAAATPDQSAAVAPPAAIDSSGDLTLASASTATLDQVDDSGEGSEEDV